LTIAIIRPFSFSARFSTGFAKSIEPKKQEGVKVMKIVTLFVGALLLVGSLGTGTAFGAAPGVISNQVITEGSYCHLTSPAIREETLSWDRPVLKDPSSGDIIDFSDRAIRTHLGKTKSTSRDWNASIAGGGATMTENNRVQGEQGCKA
jgi:hypothetical protein